MEYVVYLAPLGLGASLNTKPYKQWDKLLEINVKAAFLLYVPSTYLNPSTLNPH